MRAFLLICCAGSSVFIAGASAQQGTYNPDPGAAFRNNTDSEFYTPPAGVTPDYGHDREPLLDIKHAPPFDVNAVEKVWQNREISTHGALPPDTGADQADRWYIDIPTWKRYNTPNQETPYMYKTPSLWDPYKQSELKGDTPVLGQDIFLSLTATSFTSYEARNIPTPSGVSSYRPASSDFFGQGDQMELDQFATLSLDLFKGETVFQPVAWDLHFEPVYNFNYSVVREDGVLNPDPRGENNSDNSNVFVPSGGIPGGNPGGGLPGGAAGGTPGNPGGGFVYAGSQDLSGYRYVDRYKDYFSLEQAFVEVHLGDFSDNYDFASLRVGNQPFNADFRGFVFDDTNLGVRIFGNADSNRWQYNVAAFDMREKDTYSDLNTFDSRNQYVFIANVYRQDFLFKGYTAQLDFLCNLDDADIHYDRNGNIVRPEPIGTIVPHDLRTYYFGWNGDGHIGRWNITHSFYEVLGKDTLNGIAGQPVDINGQMAAVELSYDLDWIRYTASFFYGSGDSTPANNRAGGFDSIMDNPNFAGGPFSYYVRQGFIFGDTDVNFKTRNSLLLDIRSSKTEGQSNFVNPGVFLYGVGTELDILPSLKLFANANYILMADDQAVNYALHTNNISDEIGWDLSSGVQWRPLLTNNIIVSAGLGSLIPGEGYRTIYRTLPATVPGYSTQPGGHVDSFLYSAFTAVTLTY